MIRWGDIVMGPFLEKFFPVCVSEGRTRDQSPISTARFNSQTLTMVLRRLCIWLLLFGVLFASTMTKKLAASFSMLMAVASSVRCSSHAFAVHLAMLISVEFFVRCWCWFRHSVMATVVSEWLHIEYRREPQRLLSKLFIINNRHSDMPVWSKLLHQHDQGRLGWRISLGGAAVPAVLHDLLISLGLRTPNPSFEEAIWTKPRSSSRAIPWKSADVQAEFKRSGGCRVRLKGSGTPMERPIQ
ncbi:sugar transport protein 13-like [Camellia sinensis]|uniref:sugar transport protein 13-like n=1 Tax=Camellia sinensis TaxID=4442 RepID=UPI001036831F|nr:sugar transport protein 13-like [Camellia sinensis]